MKFLIGVPLLSKICPATPCQAHPSSGCTKLTMNTGVVGCTLNSTITFVGVLVGTVVGVFVGTGVSVFVGTFVGVDVKVDVAVGGIDVGV
jgi:hypothetical protein